MTWEWSREPHVVIPAWMTPQQVEAIATFGWTDVRSPADAAGRARGHPE